MAFGLGIPVLDEALSTAGGVLTNWMNIKENEKINQQQVDLLNAQNDFNSAEAEKQRQWEEQMSNTAYQRARKDMEAAGINPILLGTGQQAANSGQGYAAQSAASHSGHVAPLLNFVQLGINSGNEAQRVQNDTIRTAIDAAKTFMK